MRRRSAPGLTLLATLLVAACDGGSEGGSPENSGGTTSTGGGGGASGSATGGGAGAGSSGGTSAGGGGSSGAGGSGATGTGGASGSGGTSVTGTLVPLYTDPSDPTWAALVSAKQKHPSVPVIAVVNPDNGPGAAKDPSYVTGTKALADAGIVVLGYVMTGWAKTDPKTVVEPAIDHWVSWYPAVTGIFFDEQSSDAGDEAYYASLTAYAKGKGLTFTVGNPGADVPATYVGSVDMMLIYESAGTPSVASLGGWHTQHSRDNFGIIPYAVSKLDPTFVQSAKPFVRYVYLTDDDLPNPWDTLPPYFEALMTELEK